MWYMRELRSGRSYFLDFFLSECIHMLPIFVGLHQHRFELIWVTGILGVDDMELSEWLSLNGLDIKPVLDGTVKRFSNGDDKNTGWYIGSTILLPSGKEVITLTVGDWREDEKLYFRSGGGFKNGDLEHYVKETSKKTKEIEEEKLRTQEAVATQAQAIWANSHEPGDHEYLKRKSITNPIGIRQVSETLLVPTTDFSGKIWGLQRIYPDGTKRFMPGQRKKGLCFELDNRPSMDAIIVEGFATGVSVFQATGIKTYVAFDAGNLKEVARLVRDRYKSSPEVSHRIIICGDDDRFNEKNTGRIYAEEAAKEVGGIAVFPKFFGANDPDHPDSKSGTDFNDLMNLEGLDEVKRQIEDTIRGRENNPRIDECKSDDSRVDKKQSVPNAGGAEYSQSADGTGKEEDTGAEKTKVKKVKVSPFSISRSFLKDFNYITENECKLRYYQQDFYKYKNNHYQPVEDSWIKDKLNRWLVDIGLEQVAGTDKVTPIMNMIKTKPVYMGSMVEVPCFIDDKLKTTKTNMIPLKNGLFNIEKFIKKNEIEVIPHNSNYFYKHILPYDLNMSSECPTYNKIVKDCFSSDEEILAWEEVMGVHIFCPFLLERFFILSGEGANGKSVLRTILTCLLGSDNISTVPLECFNPNSFAFINTLGKLANIIPDMKDISEIDEGVLKQFISREPMIFNRKNKPYITSVPTAFLTVCTNVLPKFTDRSDGVWRRMVLFNFKKEIAKKDQDPRFRELDFWNSSGELPGIFNKALSGILRVIKKGDINVTNEMKSELEEYRHELNFVMQFTNEHLIFNKESKAKSSEVYSEYKKMVLESGGRALGAPGFARQLRASAKKLGHEISFSEKNQRIGSYVGRVWEGVQVKPCDPFIPPEAHQGKTEYLK